MTKLPEDLVIDTHNSQLRIIGIPCNVKPFIAEYQMESKGNAVLNTLIKNNGNIQQTLNMDDDEFTRQWFAYVKKKYDI